MDKRYTIDVVQYAQWLHDTYEDISKGVGWDTQEKCKVNFFDLPKANQKVMLEMAYRILEDFHNG